MPSAGLTQRDEVGDQLVGAQVAGVDLRAEAEAHHDEAGGRAGAAAIIYMREFRLLTRVAWLRPACTSATKCGFLVLVGHSRQPARLQQRPHGGRELRLHGRPRPVQEERRAPSGDFG